jgi:cysteine desulfurase
MMPYFKDDFGNAASKSHEFGWRAKHAVDKARVRIAMLINAEPHEIIFTSGATESNNLAIKGVAEFYRLKGTKIITSPIEHKSVLDVCKSLSKWGYEIVFLNVDKYGLVDINELADRIDDKTILVSIMTANNEIGTIQPINEIGEICKEKKVLFHTDAAQAMGKIPVDVKEMNTHLMSLNAHKMYGPKGIGALYIRSKRPRVSLSPQIDGGGHERGFRSGTLNVPVIAGFGRACEIAQTEMDDEVKRIAMLRDKLQSGITSKLEEVYLNGHPEKRVPNNLNLAFAYTDADSLMTSMKEIAVSSGSACSSEEVEPSYVLKAIGLSDDLAHCSIRFGLGRFNTEEEIDYTVNKVVEKVKELRGISPVYKLAKAELK